jgi:hypothetical protein
LNQHLKQELETKKIELTKAYELLDVCKLDVEKYNRQAKINILIFSSKKRIQKITFFFIKLSD